MDSAPIVRREIADAVEHLDVLEATRGWAVGRRQARVGGVGDIDDEDSRTRKSPEVREIAFGPDVGVDVRSGNRIQLPQQIDGSRQRVQGELRREHESQHPARYTSGCEGSCPRLRQTLTCQSWASSSASSPRSRFSRWHSSGSLFRPPGPPNSVHASPHGPDGCEIYTAWAPLPERPHNASSAEPDRRHARPSRDGDQP